MSSADAKQGGSDPPRILCAGIIVLDEVFRVDEFPRPDGKVQAEGFFVVNGGCAANAAVAIARLGGRAALAGPMGGPAGEDDNGDRVLRALTRERQALVAAAEAETGGGSMPRIRAAYRSSRVPKASAIASRL